MKQILTIIALLSLMTVRGQAELTRIRMDYSNIYFLLKDQSPSITALDDFSDAFFSFGDKEVANALVLESLLMEGEESTGFPVESVMLAPADSTLLRSALPLSTDLREIPYTAFIYLIMGKALNDSTEILQALFALNELKPGVFPHLPDSRVVVADRCRNELVKTEVFLRWAQEYPDEFLRLDNLLRLEAESYAGHSPDMDAFMAAIRQSVGNTFYSYFLPLGIDHCLEKTRMAATELPSNSFMRSEPEKFLDGAFREILGRKPNGSEREALLTYITENEDVTVKSVYYALLLKLQDHDE